MPNPTSSIVYYLLDRGFLTFESVVDGGLKVVERPTRYHNYFIYRQNHPGYFVKKLQDTKPENLVVLQKEANCYKLAQPNGILASLASLMPKFYGFDPLRSVLILELVSDSEDLGIYHRRIGKFPVEVGEQLGRALATYHRAGSLAFRDPNQQSVFPKQVPWILSIYQNNLQFVPQGGSSTQIQTILQRYPDFPQKVEALRSQWQTDTLIHGDMKWENCLVSPSQNGKNELELKVIDWELADIGDGYWDVAGIFQAYFNFWILSMPATPQTPPEQLVASAPYPLETLQPAMQAFWKTYAENLPVNPGEVEELRERSMMYAAARTLQTVFEYMVHSTQLTANAIYMLQISLNILQNPKEMIPIILGN
ncbi:MAG: phosphotransferase [Cyanobacteria bacterium SBLK]|nr:phosphotransferase [Cyanobacteria bacterium SBLK]